MFRRSWRRPSAHLRGCETVQSAQRDCDTDAALRGSAEQKLTREALFSSSRREGRRVEPVTLLRLTVRW